MRATNQFKLKFDESTIEDYEQQTAQLYFGHESTENKIEGNCIKYQYQVGEWYVLFTTIRDTLNEVLSIYLFDKHFKRLDLIKIYPTMPTAGGQTLENFSALSQSRFYFDFLTVKPWILTLLDKPQKNIFSWRPLCVHRPTKSLFDDVYMAIAHC